ncbi:MAG TPA: aminotransferase class I/II-fold pyridoxal phosphate-dependent enzyme [Steroidobacteraceae bacterium]|jgi:aspartate/methionine/tyrosine aminotransferase
MKLPPFLLEHWLNEYEFATPPIRYNLASSTGPSWTLRDLLALGGKEAHEELDRTVLSYAPPEGARALREQIASFHDVDPDWVIVTTGAAEALTAAYCAVAEPGASIVLPAPAFPAMPALAQAWAMDVRTYSVNRQAQFDQTAEQILRAVDQTTRLVLINTPHNPTGSVVPENELAQLSSALQERRIPLLVDEVYHPLYFHSPHPSAAKFANTLIVSDLSKAFSLSGLRLGWIIDRDAQRRKRLIDIRSYFTVSSSPLTEALAVFALKHSEAILSRLSAVAHSNLALLESFIESHREIVGWISPAGGTVCFPWMLDGRDSRPICQSLARAGVLVAPGDCFGAPEHFRVGLGAQQEGFQDALEIASGVFRAAQR